MNTTKPNNRQSFLKSDKASELRVELEKMVKSKEYNTHVVTLFNPDPMYFVEKHIKYMSEHLSMNSDQYVLNLKLMTKIR